MGRRSELKKELPKLFIVTEVFYPEDTSTAYILTQIARRFSAFYRVIVICGPAGYHKIVDNTKRQLDGIQIIRARLFRLDKNKTWQRILRLILVSFILSFKLFLQGRRNGKVLIVTNPAPMLLLVSFICKIKHMFLSILCHDVFPENLVAGGFLKDSSRRYKWLKLLFDRAYSCADYIIVLGRDMKKIFKKKLENSGSKKNPKVRIIENWADVDSIYPTLKEKNAIIKDLGIEDKKVLLFAGNLGRVQGLETLISWIKKISNKSLHFIFLGEGAVKNYLLSYTTNNRLENVTVLDGLPRGQQQLFLNACDVSIVSLARGMKGLGVPSKTYNILAAGKPILYIGEINSEVGLLVEDNQIGWVVPPGDFERFKEVVNDISMLSPVAFEKLKVRSRYLAVEKYSQEQILNKFVSLLKD